MPSSTCTGASSAKPSMVGERLEALNAAMPNLGITVLQVLREQSRYVYPLSPRTLPTMGVLCVLAGRDG